MQTLLAHCFWRLAPLCKLSHVSGGKGREGWLWQGADSPVAVVRSRTLRHLGADGNKSVGGARVNQQQQRSYSAQPCAAGNVKFCPQLFTVRLLSLLSIQLLCIVFCIYYTAASRQVVSKPQALYSVHAAFLLKISLQAHLKEFVWGCTLLFRLIVGNDKLHTPAFIFMPI